MDKLDKDHQSPQQNSGPSGSEPAAPTPQTITLPEPSEERIPFIRPLGHRPGFMEYLLSLSLTLLVYFSRFPLEPLIGFSGRYLVFATAAGLAAFLWGNGPGLLSAILGWVLAFGTLEPGFPGANSWSTQLTYGICLGLILAFQWGWRRVGERLETVRSAKLRAEIFFKTALDFSGSAVTVQDEKLCYIWAHGTAPMDPAHLIGKIETEVEGYMPELVALKRRALEKGEAEALIALPVDGRERRYEVKVRRVRQGDWNGLVTKRIDVTDLVEQKRRLEELNSYLNDIVDERTAELREKNIALRDLTRDLIRVEVAERERIARLLHDDVQQTLVAAKIRAGAVERNTPAVDLKPITDLMGTAIHDIRQLTRELTYEVWFNDGIEGALDKLVESMEQRFSIKISRKERIAPEISLALDTTARGVIFDSIREAIFNAIKHGGGADIEVGLESHEGALVATVADRGPGFSEALIKSGPGGGLAAARRRLRAIGGDAHYENRPGGGALVRMEIPTQ